MSVPDDIASNLPGDGKITPWLDRINELNFKFDPSTGGVSATALAGLNSEFPTASDIMDKWNAQITDPDERLVFPRNWNDFITALGGTSTTSGPTYDGFFNEFKEITQASNGEWAALSGVDLNEQFVASFNRFMETFRFESDGSAGPPAAFVAKWEHFMTVSSVEYATNAAGGYGNISTYQQIFRAFFPTASDADFNSFINDFVNKIIEDPSNKNHYFLPSQFLQHYYIAVQQK